MNKRIITIKNGKKRIYRVSSKTETGKLATMLSRTLTGGSVVALWGELGAGKTVFVSGICRELGIKTRITSPTFVLMLLYPIPKRAQSRCRATMVCHIDTYRLHHQKDLIKIGVQEYLGKPDVITLIEWPGKVRRLLPKNTIHIAIEMQDV